MDKPLATVLGRFKKEVGAVAGRSLCTVVQRRRRLSTRGQRPLDSRMIQLGTSARGGGGGEAELPARKV